MMWIRTYLPFGIPLALSAMLWMVPVPAETADGGMSPLVGRSVGLALLTLALLAIGYVIRSAAAPAKPAHAAPSPMALACHEFRRGFAVGEVPRSMAAQPAHDVVVRLRAPRPQRATPVPLIPACGRGQEPIEMLTRRLHDRAGALWKPRGSRATS